MSVNTELPRDWSPEEPRTAFRAASERELAREALERGGWGTSDAEIDAEVRSWHEAERKLEQLLRRWDEGRTD